MLFWNDLIMYEFNCVSISFFPIHPPTTPHLPIHPPTHAAIHPLVHPSIPDISLSALSNEGGGSRVLPAQHRLPYPHHSFWTTHSGARVRALWGKLIISSNSPNLAHKKTWAQRKLINLTSVAETSSQQKGPKLSGILHMDEVPKLAEQCAYVCVCVRARACTRMSVFCSCITSLLCVLGQGS